MVSTSFANEQYRNQGNKAIGKPNCYQKVIICAGCPIFVYGGAISALPGAFSLVTAVRFLNGRKFLFIDCGDSKHACPALPILRDVITSISFRNGHKAPPKFLGHLRLREPRRQPLQKFAQKAPQPTALKPPSTARTAGRSDRAERRFRRQPFILLSFSSSKKARKAQEMQSYQRIQCIGHTDFNTSGTNGSRGETGVSPPSATARLCAASEIPFIPPRFYIHTFPGSL